MDEIKITANFQGYIWWSDQPLPEIFDMDKETVLNLDPTANPFVNEGLLFDRKNRISYSIRYIDGNFHLRITPLESLNYKDCDIIEFHARDAKHRLRFIPEWVQYNDPLCEGMTTQKFSDYIFIGF